MPAYRLFPLGADGALLAPVETLAFNDVAAMRWAMGPAFPAGCEIWQGARFVGRVHGARPDPPPPVEGP